MTITTNTGPVFVFGISQTSSGQVMQYNEDRGPSAYDLGAGLMDPRPFYRYSPGAGPNINSSTAVGFANAQTMMLWDNLAVVDYVPATLSSSNIALSSANAPAASGALILNTSGSGLINTTMTAPESGAVVSVLAIDSTAAFVEYGQTANVTAWNPHGGTGRGVVVTTSSSGDGGSVTIAGRDMYGFKLSEQIGLSTATNTRASSNAAGYKWPSSKAYKYITAIAASSTVTSTGWAVGTMDVYGFPAQLLYVGYNSAVNLNSSAITTIASALSSANVILGSTATATSTTPDVRGLYISSLASNGVVRLQIVQSFDALSMANITALDYSPMFGVTQFSSV